MNYPTATQARHDALACVDGPVSVLAPDLPAAIERAQWAAVREALRWIDCLTGDSALCEVRPCAVCDLLADMETRLAEAAP